MSEALSRPGSPVPKGWFHIGGLLAIVFAFLELLAATTTAYVCGLVATAYLAFIFPGLLGMMVTGILFLGSIASAAPAVAAKRGQVLAGVGILLDVLAFGGLYAGCRKGFHDAERANPVRGDAKCAAFW